MKEFRDTVDSRGISTICPICQDFFVNNDVVMKDNKNHLFHIGCYNDLRKTTDKCPLDRSVFGEVERTIYKSYFQIIPSKQIYGGIPDSRGLLEKCPICLEFFGNNEMIAKDTHNHLFHPKCFDDLLLNNIKICPINRQPFSDIEIVQYKKPDSLGVIKVDGNDLFNLVGLINSGVVDKRYNEVTLRDLLKIGVLKLAGKIITLDQGLLITMVDNRQQIHKLKMDLSSNEMITKAIIKGLFKNDRFIISSGIITTSDNRKINQNKDGSFTPEKEIILFNSSKIKTIEIMHPTIISLLITYKNKI